MSKFLKSMIVLLAIVAMATPVMAEDMLSLGGQMRVRGWHLDKDTTPTNTWADQRLRIGGKLSIADGVSVTFRTDVTESNWGAGSTYGSGRLGVQQWDRAHLDLAFDSFSIRAGQQWIGLGYSSAFDAQTNGIKLATKGPVAITAFFMLPDDNNTAADDGSLAFDDNKKLADGTDNPNYGDVSLKAPKAEANTADGYFYGANVAFGSDDFKFDVFAAAQQKVTNSTEDVYMVGADATLNLGVIKLVTELEFFTGDASAASAATAYVNAAEAKDAFGTQIMVDVSLAAGEALTFGGQLYYALGDDTDTQYSYLGNGFNGWDPMMEHGTGLNNEQMHPGKYGYNARPYTFFSKNAGVMAGRVYVDSKLSDSFKLGGSITYLEPEEDGNVTVDSAMLATVGIKYNLMANTSIGAQIAYADFDQTNKKATDNALAAGFGLFVNF